MSEIDGVLRLLDKEWRGIEEIRRRSNLRVEQLTQVLRFLAKFEFAELNETLGRARLGPAGRHEL